jgi:hypothetical protein
VNLSPGEYLLSNPPSCREGENHGRNIGKEWWKEIGQRFISKLCTGRNFQISGMYWFIGSRKNSEIALYKVWTPNWMCRKNKNITMAEKDKRKKKRNRCKHGVNEATTLVAADRRMHNRWNR